MDESEVRLRRALAAPENDALDRRIAEGRDDDFRLLQRMLAAPDTGSEIRRSVLYALGRWPDRADERADLIAGALEALDESERIVAVKALSRIGGDRAVRILLGCVDDSGADVRLKVALVLRRIGTGESMDALRRLANEDDVDYVRNRATDLLLQDDVT